MAAVFAIELKTVPNKFGNSKRIWVLLDERGLQESISETYVGDIPIRMQITVANKEFRGWEALKKEKGKA